MTTTLDGMRLRALDGLAQAVLIVRADGPAARLTVAYANRAARMLFGEVAVRRRARARPFVEDAPGAADELLREAVRDGRAATIYGVGRNAEGVEFRLHVDALPLHDDAGAQNVAALYIQAQEPPNKAKRGEALAYAALDVTAEELAQVSARLRAVTAAFPGVVLFVDRDARVRFASGEGLPDLGLAEAALEDAPISEVAPDVGDELETIAQAALAGARLRFDFRVLDRVYEALAAPVRLDTGRLAAGIVALRDVTDAREAFQALEGDTMWSPKRRSGPDA